MQQAHGMAGVLVQTANYRDDQFRDFYPAQSATDGPGWYVFGRNSERYGTNANGEGNYIMLCARPDVPARRNPNYNGKVQRGWRTRREAQTIAALMNAGVR